jgi:hypothetical protein
MVPSRPSSVKFLLIDSEIFSMISDRCKTLQTSFMDAISDISSMFRLTRLFSNMSLCFSSICRLESIFLRIFSVDLRW